MHEEEHQDGHGNALQGQKVTYSTVLSLSETPLKASCKETANHSAHYKHENYLQDVYDDKGNFHGVQA